MQKHLVLFPSVRVPEDPAELGYRHVIPLSTLVLLCVLISYVDTDSLKKYLPEIWDDYDEALIRSFRN